MRDREQEEAHLFLEFGKPAISVLMTVYNGEKYIKYAIQSVLNQTFTNFELVIIDDGSTDNIKRTIMSFKDKRIKYYYKGKNNGYFELDKAVNFGLEKCKAPYIARIDADDICYPNRLRVQYEYLVNNPDIYMIGSSVDVINSKGEVISRFIKRNYPSFLYKYRIATSNSFIHSSIMFRNEGIKYPSYNEHLFYVYLVFLGKKIRNIKEVLVQYRINPEGMMSQYADLSKNKYKELYKEEGK